MAWIWVACAAVCSGTALVLQARAARQVPTAERLDAGLLTRLAGNGTYRLGIVMVAVGFVFAAAALRALPVFAVQAGRASSLAVAAVLATRLLGVRLAAREWAGVAATVAGLVALALSAPAGASVASSTSAWAPVTAAAVLALTGWWVAARPVNPGNGLLLSVLSGCGYALLALGMHVVPDLRPLTVLTSPAAWAALAGGVVALALTATAFQRAPAVAVSALTTTTETVVGAGAGIVLAADHAVAGRGSLALLGVVLVLAGAVLVAGTSATLSPQPPAMR